MSKSELNKTTNTKLVYVPTPNPKAIIQLICIPYAGGGKSIFIEWTKKISKDIEILIISLPGREDKIKDTTISNFNTLFPQLIAECKQYINKPFSIFGHSMGGVLSHGLAYYLEAKKIFPQYLIASSAPAPIQTQLNNNNILHTLSDKQFLKELSHRYQAIPPSVIKDQSLIQIFLPTLRADVTLMESYLLFTNSNKQNFKKLKCKIVATCGDFDPECNKSTLLEWKHLTQNQFFYTIFPGNHFYLHQHLNNLLNLIENLILNNRPI